MWVQTELTTKELCFPTFPKYQYNFSFHYIQPPIRGLQYRHSPFQLSAGKQWSQNAIPSVQTAENKNGMQSTQQYKSWTALNKNERIC